jgi:peroxiredoxin
VTLLEISEASTLPVGAPGPRFEDLPATDGRRLSLDDFSTSDIVVVAFTSNRCPTVKAYAKRMNQLQAAYGPRRVQLVAINSNSPHLYPEESFDRMVQQARVDGYSFPYLQDAKQDVARAYGPTRTFEIFVLDRSRTVRYHGRFDDSRLPERVTTHDLTDAMDDLLAGNVVRNPATRAFGCSLDLL